MLSSELRKLYTLVCERLMLDAPGICSMGVFESLLDREDDDVFEVPSPELAAGDKRCLARALGLGKGGGGECQPAINDVDIPGLYWWMCVCVCV